MTDEDRDLIRQLIASVQDLSQAIKGMPRSMTAYPPEPRVGGWGGGGAGRPGLPPGGGEAR